MLIVSRAQHFLGVQLVSIIQLDKMVAKAIKSISAFTWLLQQLPSKAISVAITLLSKNPCMISIIQTDKIASQRPTKLDNYRFICAINSFSLQKADGLDKKRAKL